MYLSNKFELYGTVDIVEHAKTDKIGQLTSSFKRTLKGMGVDAEGANESVLKTDDDNLSPNFDVTLPSQIKTENSQESQPTELPIGDSSAGSLSTQRNVEDKDDKAMEMNDDACDD